MNTRVADRHVSPPGTGDLLVAPASYAQQRLWLLDQILPLSSVYNTAQVLRLAGTLDRAALQRAFDALTRRQASLRTAFALRDGEVVQVVHAECPVPLAVEDLRGASTAALHQAAAQEASRPFDIRRLPLIRARLLQASDTEHWLVLTIHHIVTDAPSFAVIRHELGVFYRSFAEGRPAALQPLQMQYVDYAREQHAGLYGDAVNADLAYWRKVLEDIPLLDLPTDHPRPSTATYRGRRLYFDLEAPLAARLRNLARHERVTQFMLMVAAYAVLLHRLTGQATLAIGFPITGRTRVELEKIVGFFVNSLVVRADLTPGLPFRSVIAQVRERALESYGHARVPFERIVETLAPQRDLGRNPLFQTTLTLAHHPSESWESPDLEVEPVSGLDLGTAKFDLSLTVTVKPDTLGIRFEYPLDLFLPETVEQFARCWHTLLEAIVEDPDCAIDRLPMLTRVERDTLVALPLPGNPGRAASDNLAQAFERRVALHPHAIALVEESATLSYEELNRRANRIAHFLRATGVAPGTRVGLCLERSSAMVAAILGVRKAGGVYVPLDPAYPSRRLAELVADCAAPIVITEARFRDRLGENVRALGLDAEAATLAAQPDGNPPPLRDSPGLAYVMYTSGSTGTPKGVMVREASVLRLVCAQDYVSLGPEDVVAHGSNVAFDAATFEIWGALLNGSRLAILPTSTIVDPDALAEAIGLQGITCMFLTTSVFNQMADRRPDAFRRVRHLLFGGEAADPRRVRAVLDAGGPEHLSNAYGPTETTTFATAYRIEGDPGASIPIGRPIRGAGILLVDRNGEPVPRGVVGEILIRGDGVAEGYLGLPELTAERFVSDPAPQHAGQRAYRSGDLGRWRVDGTLEFIGRIDEQVKIRGYRIEPGEIRSVLAGHPDVRDAHVIARPQPTGDRGLTAYVVAPGVDIHVLRAWLAERVPAFMVPASFVPVATLPLNANGKIDLRALPDPAPSPSAERPHGAPRDALETTLCASWKATLGVPRVGIDDNFFELGGHSLLAARLFTRLDEELGIRLPLATLFTAPTVRMLAERYRSAGPKSAHRMVVPVQPAGSRMPLFVVPGVFGDVVGFAPLARELGTEQPLYALQSPGLGEDEAPLTRIEEIAALAVHEIRSVQLEGPYAVAGACFGGTVAYEIARQLLLAGQDVAFLGLLDPTARGGTRAEWPIRLPRPVRRTATAVAFGVARLSLYRSELSALRGRARREYMAAKLRTVAGTMLARRSAKPVAREVDRLEVYRSNVAALETYRRHPLPRPVRVVVLLQTQRQSPQRNALAQAAAEWGQEFMHSYLPGRDSGDMLGPTHVGAVARELQRALRLAEQY